jgi:hypothetical protein
MPAWLVNVGEGENPSKYKDLRNETRGFRTVAQAAEKVRTVKTATRHKPIGNCVGTQ